MSFANHRGIVRVPSVPRLVAPGDVASPLAQLSLNGESSYAGPARRSREEAIVPPVPPLKLNLFRTPSVYSTTSTASLDSLSTISTDERAFNNLDGDDKEDVQDKGEGPSTPRAAVRDQQDYFSGHLTPRSASRAQGPPNGLGSGYPSETIGQIVTHPAPAVGMAEEVYIDDTNSIHGEQGSEWGDDEADFEWLDTANAPAAENGDDADRVGQGARLGGRIKSVVRRTNSTRHVEPSTKVRKNLVFPRRPPPPPPVDTPSAPPSHFSPNPLVSSFHSPNVSHHVPSNSNLARRPTLPRPDMPSRGWTDGNIRPGLGVNELFIPTAKDNRTPPNLSPTFSSFRPSTPKLPKRGSSKDLSHLSVQSAAYSFYDLDALSSGRSTTPTSRDFPSGVRNDVPNGRYAKVTVSQLEREQSSGQSDIVSKRSPTLGSAERTRRSLEEESGISPEELVARGIEARGNGDLPRSAWYFMRAAEGGSATGRMYWGLALRHGWGVAKDDKRALAELRQACDEALAGGGGLNFHQSPGAAHLSLSQKKAWTRDLSLGMFEIANCFLDGVGVNRAPEVALSYLRVAGNLGDIAAQEQLGFLLSKGGNGVKKDMNEAAKWYRMAISQGSTNTFGLAWVWKEKYM